MKTFSIETRKRMSEAAKRRCTPEWIKKQQSKGTQLPLETVVRLYYKENHTQQEIARILGVTQKVVHNFMHRNHLKARKAAKRNQYRENNASWKGGVKDGYIRIPAPSDSFHSQCDGYIYEHDYIMEQHIGRALREGEVVHHKNGIKDDNRLENLELLTSSEHMRLHMLKRYAKKEVVSVDED